MFEVAVEAVNFASEEYVTLFARSVATPFQHPLWLDRLYRVLAPRLSARPLLITVRSRANGELLLMLPLVRRRYGLVRAVEFADLQVSDYAAPIYDEETFMRIVSDAETCRRLRRATRPYDVLWIRKICHGAPLVERLFGPPAPAHGHERLCGAAQRSLEQWRADHLNASFRRELDKKSREIRRIGEVRVDQLTSPELIRAAFVQMQEFRRGWFPESDLLRNPVYFDFYLDVAVSGAASGFSRTYVMQIGGETVACVRGLCAPRSILDPAVRLRFPPLQEQVDRRADPARDRARCVERGDTLLDFTIGDEPYKRRFGATSSPMWMIAASGSPLGLAVYKARQNPWMLRLAKSLLGRTTPAAAGAATSSVAES